jgi:hypothetical protein
MTFSVRMSTLGQRRTGLALCNAQKAITEPVRQSSAELLITLTRDQSDGGLSGRGKRVQA